MCVCSCIYPACKVHVPYYIFVCGLAGSTKFFHIIAKRHDFLEKKKLIEHEMCVLKLIFVRLCVIRTFVRLCVIRTFVRLCVIRTFVRLCVIRTFVRLCVIRTTM